MKVMKSRSLSYMIEKEFKYEEVFKDNPSGMLMMIVSDLACMEGYIAGL